MKWTRRTADQKAQAVKDLLGEGATYSEIARALGTSREAVAGVCYRRRLESQRRWGVNRKKENTAVTREKAKRARQGPRLRHAGLDRYVALDAPPATVDSKPLFSAAWVALEGSTPVPLDQRTGCAWPLGDGHPFLFCNDPVQDGKSWCATHFALGNRPVTVGTSARRPPKPFKELKGLTS